MKKLLFILLLFPLIAFSQFKVSSDKSCSLGKDDFGKWKANRCYDELCFFEFNKDLSIMKHTTPGLTSSYLINTLTKSENDSNVFYMNITSDVGNDYFLVLSYTENCIIIYKGDEWGCLYMIKKIWR